MADHSDDLPYLTAGEAARILRVSPKTVNRWADDGRIPCFVTLGGHRRFTAEAIADVASAMRMPQGRESKTSS